MLCNDAPAGNLQDMIHPAQPLPTSPAHADTSAQTVAILRLVLAQLTAARLELTPENFAQIYRRLQRQQKVPGAPDVLEGREYELVYRALLTLNHLIVADPWLQQIAASLIELLQHESMPERVKRERIKRLINDIANKREELLFRIVEATRQLQQAIAAVVTEFTQLSRRTANRSGEFVRFADRIENCHDVEDARALLAEMAIEVGHFSADLVRRRSEFASLISTIEREADVVLTPRRDTARRAA